MAFGVSKVSGYQIQYYIHVVIVAQTKSNSSLFVLYMLLCELHVCVCSVKGVIDAFLLCMSTTLSIPHTVIVCYQIVYKLLLCFRRIAYIFATYTPPYLNAVIDLFAPSMSDLFTPAVTSGTDCTCSLSIYKQP